VEYTSSGSKHTVSTQSTIPTVDIPRKTSQIVKRTKLSVAYVIDQSMISLLVTINVNVCTIERKWNGKKLTYDTITRWGEYE